MSTHYVAYTPPNWNESYGIGNNYPAYFIDWGSAVLYCNARSKQDNKDTVYSYTTATYITSSIQGAPDECSLSNLSIDFSKNGYRLPTEAEWEYACRAGTQSQYFWGTASMDEYAWYRENSGSISHIVGNKLANGYGLYDMCGNVWEWCNDWYADYDSQPKADPTGPTSGNKRVIRGGSWYNFDSSSLQSAARYSGVPDPRFGHIGFRCVRAAH